MLHTPLFQIKANLGKKCLQSRDKYCIIKTGIIPILIEEYFRPLVFNIKRKK